MFFCDVYGPVCARLNVNDAFVSPSVGPLLCVGAAPGGSNIFFSLKTAHLQLWGGLLSLRREPRRLKVDVKAELAPGLSSGVYTGRPHGSYRFYKLLYRLL